MSIPDLLYILFFSFFVIVCVYMYVSVWRKQSLLNDPNTKSPANREASDLFDNNKMEYQNRVLEFVEDSLHDGVVAVPVPIKTMWEGGTFRLTMQFTEEYPNKPPEVKFLTKMFHPNSTFLSLLIVLLYLTYTLTPRHSHHVCVRQSVRFDFTRHKVNKELSYVFVLMYTYGELNYLFS